VPSAGTVCIETHDTVADHVALLLWQESAFLKESEHDLGPRSKGLGPRG
jgi:hypothetical protein